MHEVGLIKDALGAALARAEREGARRVERVTCCIGAESGVDPDVVDFIFPLATSGTIAEGAALAIERIEVRCRCRVCAEEFAPDDLLHICPRCGRPGAPAIAGRDFRIASLDIT